MAFRPHNAYARRAREIRVNVGESAKRNGVELDVVGLVVDRCVELGRSAPPRACLDVEKVKFVTMLFSSELQEIRVDSVTDARNRLRVVQEGAEVRRPELHEVIHIASCVRKSSKQELAFCRLGAVAREAKLMREAVEVSKEGGTFGRRGGQQPRWWTTEVGLALPTPQIRAPPPLSSMQPPGPRDHGGTTTTT